MPMARILCYTYGDKAGVLSTAQFDGIYCRGQDEVLAEAGVDDWSSHR